MRRKSPETTRNQNDSGVFSWGLHCCTGWFSYSLTKWTTFVWVNKLDKETVFPRVQSHKNASQKSSRFSQFVKPWGPQQGYPPGCAPGSVIPGNIESLKFHCRYFNQQTITDSTTICARSNKIKTFKLFHSWFFSMNDSQTLPPPTASVYTVFGFKFSHLFTYSRLWLLSDKYTYIPENALVSTLIVFYFIDFPDCLSMQTLSHPPSSSHTVQAVPY